MARRARRPYIAFLLLLAGQALAIGPVGSYLGYRLGLVAVSRGFARDSLHLTLPVRMDTAGGAAFLDTAIVESELVFHGLPGYLQHVIAWSDTLRSSSYDTTYESTGVYLKRKQVVGDTHAYVTRYMVPFSVGSWWRTGIEGSYFTPPDSTGAVNTIQIWADTARVEARETVVTPYGTVPDCYRIRSFSRWCVAARLQGYPFRDSMTVAGYEWYKDSLWSVKDTTFSVGAIYVQILNLWLRAGSSFVYGLTELVSLGMSGVGQGPECLPGPTILHLSPDPFHTSCVIELASSRKGLTAAILDNTGRRVYAGPARNRWEWRPDGLPPGVYQVVLSDGRRVVARATAVYLK